MTSKDRVLTAVAHQTPDRVPVDYCAHPEVNRTLLEYLNLPADTDILRMMEVDLRGTGPVIKWQASPVCYADPTIEVTDDELFIDLWGVGFRRAQTPTGEYIDIAFHPLKNLQSIDELDSHRFMSPDEWDYSTVHPWAQSQAQWAVGCHSRGAFEISWFIRGMDGFMLDLALEPKRAMALYDRIIEALHERLRRMLEAGGGIIDIGEYNDDVGSQNGLMLSPEMWRQYFKPRTAAMFELIKSYGAKVKYHSCGSVHAILPDLIDIGLDILNPVQPLATNMNPMDLKREFGRHITFHGGIDMQNMLPNSTADEVREHTQRLLDVMNVDGGWIACASHSLQPDTPPENVVAMYETLLGHELK